MARKTVAELLAAGKKERDRIQKEAFRETEKLTSKVPAQGPPGTAAPIIARGVVEIENALMDYAIDRLAAEAGHIGIGPYERRRSGSTFDPNNPITRWMEENLQFSPPVATRTPKPPRPRTDPQIVNDEILRIELKNANGRARKKNGQFKKGWDQRRVMLLAQKECTKERERLGLCKKKSTRKGQRRKTARRAYAKRLKRDMRR